MSAADLPGAQLRIKGYSEGTFEPDPAGFLAYILNVETWHGDVIDYVAWPIDNERKWWLRRGIGAMLGEANLYRADWRNEPVLLWKTPADWLRAEIAKPGNHCCVLDWTCDPRFILNRAPEIQCVGEDVRARLAARVTECATGQFKLSVTHDA